MIIDCHHHVIQHWIGACGHPSREVHARYIQKMLTRTVAATYRARDGAPSDTKALFRPGEEGWSGLGDVAIRVGRFGQLEFTVDGEDHYVQYMPVGMQHYEAPPELALAQMTYAGVDHAVLQAGGAYGAMSDYNAFAQNLYPDRFTGLMWVDEAMAGSDEGLAEIERARGLGLRGIYYNCEGFARHAWGWSLDDARMDPFFGKLAADDIILCLELSPGPTYDKSGYVRCVQSLETMLDRHKGIRIHLAMGPPVHHFGRSGHFEFPEEVLRVYRRDDFLVEIMLPITWGGVWDYPYPEARPLIEDMRNLLGAEKLIWGSDMPNVERFCTFRQSLDYVRRYCTFFTPAEMDLVLGDNLDRMYRISERRSRVRA